MSRIAIKIGSRVLTREDGGPDDEAVTRLVDDIVRVKSSGNEVLLITSGAVAWGRAGSGLANDFSVVEVRSGRRGTQRRLLREQILASVGQPLLIARYTECFAKLGVRVSQILVTREDLASQQRYESVRAVTLNLLAHGIVPIFNENDVLSSEEIDFSDNDQLACILATALQADQLAILTDVDGILDKAPGTPGATLLRVVDNVDTLHIAADTTMNPLGKGGIRSKLEAARLVTSFGIQLSVVNGAHPEVLSKLFLHNQQVGTRFLARGEKLKQRKSWVALAALSRGEIVVSTFLAESLAAHRTASILVIGVESLSGQFRQNDVVTVKDMSGRTLGRGEVRMSSDALQERIDKRRRGQDVELFGSEVIHCDYFVSAPT